MKTLMTDAELLESYVGTGSAETFALIVRRHVDAVYGAARRQVRDEALAQDVTQAVFILLAQRASSIQEPHLLAGWLLKTTRYCAADARKVARRRQIHEQRAAAMRQNVEHTGEANGIDSGEYLDAHLAALSDWDRSAVVLRYLEERPLAEVARELNISEEAAKKRVARALEKLRKLFGRQDAIFSASALATELGRHIIAAPPELVGKVCATVLAGPSTGIPAAIAKGVVISMRWTLVKLAVLWTTGLIAVAVGTVMALRIAHPHEALVEDFPVATTTIAPETTGGAATEPAMTEKTASVFVAGKVMRPGVYTLYAEMSPRQMITAAGIDPETRVSGWLTIVRRTGPHTEHQMILRIQSVMEEVNMPAEARVLKANDVLTISVKPPKPWPNTDNEGTTTHP